jgi:glucose/arabinose dehydrogenase
MERRHFLAAAAAGVSWIAGCGSNPTGSAPDTGRDPTDAAGPTAGPSGTATAEPTAVPSAVSLDPLATGLDGPLDVAFPGGDRQYVAEQRGLVRVVDADGIRPEPLLDLREAVVTGGEKGLLGIALHPAFPETRRLFVRYSAPPRAGTPSGYSHTFVLAAFEVGEDGLSARRESERTVLEIPQPQGNHNAGSLVFGPDGLLFVGVGDGGAGGDQGPGHADDWYGAVPGGNGQDVTANLLGSVLRIDVDGRESGGGYAVPDDNPLVGREGLDEQYAWGLRNPWRLAVDGEDLYAGDVGQNRYEEIDLVEAGGNYGWNVREGTHCYRETDCPDTTPANVRGGEALVDPVVEYPHSGEAVAGISVIAGNVYRGTALPALGGTYVFGDFRAAGRLFTATPTDDGLWPTSVLPVVESDADRLQQLRSIGRYRGELYVLGAGGSGGGLYRLGPPA